MSKTITFMTDIKVEVNCSEEDFRVCVVETIDFAVNNKEYELKDISPDFIAEDITGISGEHGMSADALAIIGEELQKFAERVFV